MRTSDVFLRIGLIGVALGLTQALAFDGKPASELTPDSTPVVRPVARPLSRPVPAARGERLIPPASIPHVPAARHVPTARHVPAARLPAARLPTLSSANPFDALRSGTVMLREGRTDQGVMALEYAAGKGVPAAMWKLGRIYADGEGVTKDQLRSFEYFRDLTRAHAYDPPATPYARYVANAFVMVGRYYLHGIPNSNIKADPEIAHRMFRHAAAHFGDVEAQYLVGRMYLEGLGTPKDGIQAARWLRLAANKGHRGAQALLGAMLFKGKDVARQAAMGLFWLTVAKDGARPDEKWIIDTYNAAAAQATEDERAVAFNYLLSWMEARRPRRRR
jgi:exopolysaccharide production negative regulator